MTPAEALSRPLPFTVRWHDDGGWNWGTVVEVTRSGNNHYVATIHDGRGTVRREVKSIVPSEPGVHP